MRAISRACTPPRHLTIAPNLADMRHTHASRTTPMDIVVKDSNGAKLSEGDSVTVIKDLKVKGSSTVLKRGTMIRNIHLTDDPDEIEGRTDKVKGLVLRTEFLKKA
jgi:protein PhnA